MINSFNIGSITIHFYSLCILLGVIVAYFLITGEGKRQGIKDDDILNIVFYGLLIGILGARIYYVIFNMNYYMYHLDEIVKVWEGGLAIHGGILFGALTVYIYSKKKNISFIKLTDIILPGVIIAQAIGRWGNFFNQEAYGMAVNIDTLHKLLVPNFIIKGMFIRGQYYLPTFYFESIFCLIGFILMLLIRNKNKRTGVITAFYLIWYGVLRFIIEIFRTDSLMLFNFKIAMIVSAISIFFGVIILVRSKE